MINTDMNQFMDYLNYGGEIDILYRGSKYLVEGYRNEDKLFHLFVYKYEENGKEADEMIYEVESSNSVKECADNLINIKFRNPQFVKKLWISFG